MPKPNDSVMWKSLLAMREEAEKYLFWVIGKGQASFWRDHWLGNSPLISMADASPQSKNCTVSDFLQGRNWNYQKLQEHLPLSILGLIKQLPPLQAQDDQCILKDVNSIKEISRHRRKSKWAATASHHWGNWIWNSWTKPSTSFFMWRLIQNWLPTDEILQARGVLLASKCPLCLNHAESIQHIFLQCSFTAEVWQLLGCKVNSQISNVLQLLHPKGLNHISWSSKHRISYIMTICWFIWCSRNSAKHNSENQSAVNCSFSIRKHFMAINGLIASSTPSKAAQIPQLVFWYPPPPSWTKINVDGSFHHSTNKAGIGGCFRDNQGKLLFYFLGPTTAYSPLEAELKALLVATLIAKRKNLNMLWFETDSQLLFSILTGDPSSCPWTLIHTAMHIQCFLKSFHFTISHIHREGNLPADYLAKKGLQATTLHISRKLFSLLNQLLVGDKLNLPFIRF